MIPDASQAVTPHRNCSLVGSRFASLATSDRARVASEGRAPDRGGLLYIRQSCFPVKDASVQNDLREFLVIDNAVAVDVSLPDHFVNLNMTVVRDSDTEI